MPAVAALLALLALHVGLRLVAWHNTVVMMNDGVHFLWQAERLLEGDWLAAVSHPYHPLYAASTALVGLGVDDLEWAGVLASLLASAAWTVACWTLARRLFPDRPGAAAGAALVAAVNARSLQFGSDVQAEMLMAALVAWGLVALLAMAQRRGCGRRAALAGLLTGLAYLARFEGLILGLPLVLWLVGAGGVPLGRRLRVAGLFGATLALCVVPYVLALHEVSGRWGLSLKPSLQQVGMAEVAPVQLAPEGSPLTWPQINRDRDWDALARRWRPGTPGAERAAARRAARQATGGASSGTGDGTAASPPPGDTSDTRTPPTDPSPADTQPADTPPADAAPASPPPAKQGALLAPPTGLALAPRADAPWLAAADTSLPAALSGSAYQLLHTLRGETLLPALIGLLMLLRSRRRLALTALALVGAWWLAGALQIHRNGFLTNRHMLLPLVVLLPLAGAGFATLWQRHWLSRLLAAALVYESLRAGLHLQRDQVLPRLEALAWVREHTAEDEHFLTQRQRDGWYARRTPVTSRFPMDMGALRDRIARHQVRYLVLDEDDVQRWHPDWAEQGWTREVARFGDDEHRVVVLEPSFP